jgi:hypothetical protein
LLSRLSFQGAALLAAQLWFLVSVWRDHVLRPGMWFIPGGMDLRWITQLSLHPGS